MYLLGSDDGQYILGSDAYVYEGVPADATPDAFSFSDISNANPGEIVTDTVAIFGVDAGETLTAVSFLLSNNGGATWASSVTVIPGQTLVRATVTASSTFGGEATQTGSVNGVSATFTVTTREAVTTPAAFSFDAVTGANPGATVMATALVTGVDAGVALTAVNFELSNNSGGTWSSSVAYVPGQTLVRATVTASGTSQGVESLTGSVNGVEATFTVTTRVVDTTPAAYSFAEVDDAEPGAVVTATAPISGVEPGITLTAATFELSNNLGASWSSSVTYIPGQTIVRATVTASTEEAGVVTQSGSVNGVGATFSVTTLTFDTTPDQFSFSSVLNAAPGATVYSVRAIAGVTTGIELVAVNFELSNDNRQTWSGTVTYVPGETYVRATVAASMTEGVYVEQSGSVNGVAATFRARTRLASAAAASQFIVAPLTSGLTSGFSGKI